MIKQRFLIFCFNCFLISSAMAQGSDPSSNKVYRSSDTIILADLLNKDKPAPLYKHYILPVAMIGYGLAATYTDAFQDVNESIKEEIWTEAPHKKLTIDNYLQFAPAITVYSLNLVGINGKNNLLDRSMIYLLSNVFLNTTVTTVKSLTNIQRPDGTSKSFPSGHTAEAFASAEFMRQEYNDVSPWYGIAGYAAATATGLLRVYNNKHWFGDVIAGAGVGIASTKLAYWIYPLIKRRFTKGRNMHTIILPYYQSGNAGVLMVYSFK